MRRWTKVVLIVGGLSVFFLLDDLLVFFVLKEAFPKAFRPSLVTIVVGCAGVLSVLVAWLAFKALRRKPTTGREGLIGEKGRALSAISGGGEVFVHGEIWKALSEEEIQEGDVIEVVEVDGLALRVRKPNP
jgi:membrane-bound serine protease (ClpP class)